MNKNSNTYQILYSSIMVVVVGAVLAFVYMALKPQQTKNIDNDKRMQILSAVRIAATNDNVEQLFNKHVTGQYLMDLQGNVVDSTQDAAFKIEMKKNVKLADSERKLPVYICTLENGETKYVIPVYGAGLWGPVWGYVAVDADGSTIYGANFSHEGETPGLGARIADDSTFHQSFRGKQLIKEGAYKGIEVVKKGLQTSVEGADYVDALSGATITSRGVSDMLSTCLKYYEPFLKGLQSKTAK